MFDSCLKTVSILEKQREQGNKENMLVPSFFLVQKKHNKKKDQNLDNKNNFQRKHKKVLSKFSKTNS